MIDVSIITPNIITSALYKSFLPNKRARVKKKKLIFTLNLSRENLWLKIRIFDIYIYIILDVSFNSGILSFEKNNKTTKRLERDRRIEPRSFSSFEKIEEESCHPFDALQPVSSPSRCRYSPACSPLLWKVGQGHPRSGETSHNGGGSRHSKSTNGPKRMQMLIARPYAGKSVVLSRLWNERYSREVDGSEGGNSTE